MPFCIKFVPTFLKRIDKLENLVYNKLKCSLSRTNQPYVKVRYAE